MSYGLGGFDGHSGIDHDVQETDTVGDFQTALSYVKEQDTGHFVIHAYSSTFDVGPGIDPNDFLKEIGFTEFEGCNALDRNDCYYHVLKGVDRNPTPDLGAAEHPHKQYEQFVDGLEDAYEQYREADEWMQDVGLDAAHR
jgi:hypothetical protein